MELGLNGATTGPRVDLLTDIRVAGAAGFSFVELRDDKIEAFVSQGGTLERAREALTRERVRCASLNALEDATLAEGAAWEARLIRWEQLCRWARELGSDLVVAVPSALPPGMDAPEVTRRTRRALDRLASVAERHGIRTGFEFLGFGWCSVRSLAHAVEIVEGASGIGLVVDTFHCHAGGVPAAELRQLDPRRLFLVHLDDAVARPLEELHDRDRVLPGAGVMPLREMVEALTAAGYDGGFSVELFRPEYWTWDPDELARQSLAAARRGVEAGRGRG